MSRHPDGAVVSLDDAVATLSRIGARVFCILPGADDSLSLDEAAKRLSVGPDWVRKHLTEFPNAWRLPAGERKTRAGEGRNVGEIRIPVQDIVALQTRQRLRKAQVTS